MHGTTVDLELSIPLGQRREAIIRCIHFIESNPEMIREILTEISTYQTAELEIQASLGALKNAFNEVHNNRPPLINRMSVFMPSNVILYSYVLYLLIPSLYTESIEFRSSASVLPQVRKLHHLLQNIHQLPLKLLELSHREYMKASVLHADVVVFSVRIKMRKASNSNWPKRKCLSFLVRESILLSYPKRLNWKKRFTISSKPVCTTQDKTAWDRMSFMFRKP